MTRSGAWIAVGILGAVVVGLWLVSFFPLFGALAYLVLPSAIVLLIAITVGASACLTSQAAGKTYFAVVLGTLVLFTGLGAHLRHQGDSSGSARVYHESSITRPIVVRLREPVLLDADGHIGYDRAMFDSVQPWCREPCVVIERLDWYQRHTFEEPKGLLEDIGVKPIQSGDARIKVQIEDIEHPDRIEINASVFESGTITASWKASLPAWDRKARLPRPTWVQYALENNPLVLAVMPERRYLDEGLLESFLRSALVPYAADAAPVAEIEATELMSKVLAPALKVDRSDPEYMKWWFRAADERCAGVVSTERRPGIAEKYVTFLAAGEAGPQLSIGNESLICAGDAVYVHRYGRTPIDVLDFSRYSLSGQHTADLRIRLPKHAVTTFIAFDLQSVSERDGKVTLIVRNVRFERARDDKGTPVKKPSGQFLEYAIIEREGEYAAVLPPYAK